MNVKDLTVTYGNRPVLQNLYFEAKVGQVNLLIGRNGSGKSTFLRVLAGLVTPSSGTIFYRGKNISRLNRRERLNTGIVYIRQKDNIYPDLFVSENLKIASYAAGKGKRFDEIIGNIGEYFPLIKTHLSQKAGLLSGGEKQQLAISMGILQEPTVLLIDEPSAGLSPILVEEILRQIYQISNRNGVTVILVEQNIQSVCRLFSEVNLLTNGGIEVLDISSTEEKYLNQIYSGMMFEKEE